jgi:enoyl-[acyl-carrier protein] reductase I
MLSLQGKKGLIVGIANQHSIAYGCAKVLHEYGAELAITYLNEKAADYVIPLAKALDAPIIMPCDVSDAEQLHAVFDQIERQWGKLDFLIHSIAYCPLEDLHSRVIDSHWDAMAQAMNISCHSFIRMAKHAEALMQDGGSLLAISYIGGERVVPQYSLMGPVKAALELSSRYMAIELAAQKIRCNILSPGPIKTRAASGVRDFNTLYQNSLDRSPSGTLANIDDVGRSAAFLVSDDACAISGTTLYVDDARHALA